MKSHLIDRLMKRELGYPRDNYSDIRGLYGDRYWVDNLDIVNELSGHSGCVNALSWSKSGNLLASGSDDQFVNIHAYLPDGSREQFSLTTAISTGHTANIFSVKFMPHTNDRTLVTAAGDNQVRIFDIEYSGQTANTASEAYTAAAGRRRGRKRYDQAVRYLSQGDTNARVYRSHSERVKRIVTESSPNLFLTCSEDGEVRQWDLRQPSSAYPPPLDRRGMGDGSESENVPPPLISYKCYDLDLNTISCSPSQPHYIALGGRHLHCFLHDRRMLGRDRLSERGGGMSSSSTRSDQQDELMGQATRCVRKFAPNGQPKMKKMDNGHITACKISDAYPNEILVSWSGDHIYNFNLVHSPDAGEEEEPVRKNIGHTPKSKGSRDRKRKTKPGSATSREGALRATSQARIAGTNEDGASSSMALRVQYGNGQSEDIPIEAPQARSPITEAREALLPEAQRQSYRIGKGAVAIRVNLFSLAKAKDPSPIDPTGHVSSLSSTLGYAASLLPEMDEIMKTWRYPMNPHELDVHFQKTLQKHRASAWRFVQASGTISRVLGGRLQTASGEQTVAFQHFAQIRPAPKEGTAINQREQFGYDFIRAILLWLESGVGGLLRGFSVTEAPAHRLNQDAGPRYPVSEDATVDAIDEVLIPYLQNLADKRPILDLDTSRFEVDKNRILFESEEAAVAAFAQAVKIPFEDLSSAVRLEPSSEGEQSREIAAQDRRTALKHWGLKVARGVLMNAAEGVNFGYVDRAFGGRGRPDSGIRADEQTLQTMSENINGDAEEETVRSIEVTRTAIGQDDSTSAPSALEVADDADAEESLQGRQVSVSDEPVESGSTTHSRDSEDADHDGDDDAVVPELDEEASVVETDSEDDEGGEDDEDDEDEEEEEDDDDDDDDPGGLARMFARGPFLRRSTFNIRAMREKVEESVPCSPHTRVYRGHCNVRTVKDVNFFGLQDEYVVSGSDSGHVFIWENKTGQLVNILEGDGEVVNVIQGHPYEPMLAVSGIDHTIKIFSADSRARELACKGIGVSASDASTFSSINFGSRLTRQRPSQAQDEPTSEPAMPAQSARMNGDTEDDSDSDWENGETPLAPNGLASRRRMHQEYEITSQNDNDRQGGNQEAVITRSMLSLLAQRIRERQEGGGGQGGEGSDTIVISDECNVM